MYCNCCHRFSYNGRFYYLNYIHNPYDPHPTEDPIYICDYCWYSCNDKCAKIKIVDEDGNCIHLFPIHILITKDNIKCANCNLKQKDLYTSEEI